MGEEIDEIRLYPKVQRWIWNTYRLTIMFSVMNLMMLLIIYLKLCYG